MEFSDRDSSSLEQRRKEVAKRIQELRIAGHTLEEEKSIELPNNFEEREYQLESWAAIWEARQNGEGAALLHLATGLGKTSVAVLDVMKFQQERAEQDKPKPKVLFVSHQDNLLGQAKNRFLDFLPHNSTEKYKTGKDNLPEADITFATFQSLRNELGRFSSDHFDYIIYDEAHHTQADTFSDVVEHFDPEFQLALTATPERTDEKDIREHFGEPVYSKTLPEAMAEGLVANVDYHIVFDDAIKKAMEEGFDPTTLKEIKELLSVNVRNETITKNILEEREQMDLGDSKTIVFCNSVSHANEMADFLGGEAYHSGISKEKQKAILKRFRNGILQTITVKDMFNEGVDIPDARLIVFLRSTQSKTVFEQQLGRGLRKQPGKDTVSVLDFVANIERLTMMQDMIEDIKRRSKELGETTREGSESTSSGFDITTSHDNFEFDRFAIELTSKLNELFEAQDRSHLNLLSNEEIIALALRLSPNKPLGSQEIGDLSKNNDFPSVHSISDRFGSLPKFQQACGFEVNIWSDYSNEELVGRALEISPDEPLNHRKLAELSKENQFPDGKSITKRFGSLLDFHKACGFEVRNLKNLTADEIIELAKEISSDKPLSVAHIQQLSKNREFVSGETIRDRFGSMVSFHKACGFEVKEARSWSNISNEELVALAKELSPNKPLGINDIAALSKERKFPGTKFIKKRFGPIAEFHRACGFEVKNRKNWSKVSNEELIQIAKKLSPDKPLLGKDIEKISRDILPNPSSLHQRFGSLKYFHEACGFEVRKTKDWSGLSDEELVTLGKELSSGKKLTAEKMNKLAKEDLFPTVQYITKRFGGSLFNFHRACGFED